MKPIIAVAVLLCISVAPLTAAPKTKDKKSQVSVSKPVKTPVDAKSVDATVTDTDPSVEENPEIVIVLNTGPSDKNASTKPADVSTPDPKDEARAQRRSELSQKALSFRGTRYVWGGYGRNGFDCSGFTQFLMAKEGVKLPHSAKQQFSCGAAVEQSDLQEGDLVFFNTARGPLTHVGMYIGNGEFVHAANPRRGVTINKLTDAYYANRYAGARRMTN